MKRKLEDVPFGGNRPKCPFWRQDGLFDNEIPLSDKERINRESIEGTIREIENEGDAEELEGRIYAKLKVRKLKVGKIAYPEYGKILKISRNQFFLTRNPNFPKY